jgi:hypothetical protein
MLAYQSLDGTARINGQDDAVDGVDRSSDAPPTDVTFRGSSLPEPIARLQNAGNEMPSQPQAQEAPASASGEAEQSQDNAARRPSATDDAASAETGDDADTFATPAQQSALHASLSTIARRRLQMVEAMSGFAEDQGAADLSLRPQRHVDARVLELLTSVPPIKVA